MNEKRIKSGHEVIEEFLAAMESSDSIDASTVAIVRKLFGQELLNVTRLEQSLAKARQAKLQDVKDQEN